MLLLKTGDVNALKSVYFNDYYWLKSEYSFASNTFFCRPVSVEPEMAKIKK